MRTQKFSTSTLKACARVSTLMGLTALFALQTLVLQASCGVGIVGSMYLSDTNGNSLDFSMPVQVGDVLIVSTDVHNVDAGYRMTGIVCTVVLPNGSNVTAMTIPSLRAGSSCDESDGGLQGLHCPGEGAIGTLPSGASCFPCRYTVAFADINNSNTLTCAGTRPGPSRILFKQLIVGTAINAEGTTTGHATECAETGVEVIFPCVSITKECVVANNSTSLAISVTVRGTVCNSGDSPLSSVQVIDTPLGASSLLSLISAASHRDPALITRGFTRLREILVVPSAIQRLPLVWICPVVLSLTLALV